jgi:hypothetical protein
LQHNPGGVSGPNYDDGRHVLLHGRENDDDLAYVSVPDPDYHVTLLTPVDENGLTGFNTFEQTRSRKKAWEVKDVGEKV